MPSMKKLLNIKPVLWAIVFNDECNAIHDEGDKNGQNDRNCSLKLQMLTRN